MSIDVDTLYLTGTFKLQLVNGRRLAAMLATPPCGTTTVKVIFSLKVRDCKVSVSGDKRELYSVVRYRSLSDSGLDAEMQHDLTLVVDPVYAQVTCHP